jgi:2-phosphosulfolactate phosphatase
MLISVFLIPHELDELALRGKRVVVVDVLRSSTTVVVALANGAREVIPASSVEAAAKISGNLAQDIVVLGGEQHGRMIEGFHLGNSPLEYNEESVRGKVVVFTSTNGSPLILKSRHAAEVLVGSFVNISSIGDVLSGSPEDAVVLCAGNDGAFALEDAVCAGMLLHLLRERGGEEVSLDDAGVAAEALYRSYGKNLHRMLRQSASGQLLQELGYTDDLKPCAEVDTIPVVPVLEGNVLRIRRDGESRSLPAAAPGA